MATMYRMAGNGNWSDLMWSDSYGGASNGLVPDSTTDVLYTDQNTGYTTTITSAAHCKTIGVGGPTPKTLVSSGGYLNLYGTSSLTALITTSLDVNLAGGIPALYAGTIRNLTHTGGSWNVPDPITVTNAINITSGTGSVEFSGGVTAPSISASTPSLATLNSASCTGDISFTGTSAVSLGGTSNCTNLTLTGSGTATFASGLTMTIRGNCTVSANTSAFPGAALKFTASSGTQTFATGGRSFPTIWNAQTSTAGLTISGTGSTFGVFRSDSGRTTTFTAGQTFGIGSCNASGMIIRSTTTSAYTWNNTSGSQIDIPNANVQYSTATGTGGFRASGAYTDAGNNTGWFFGNASSGGHRFFMFF